MAQYEDCPYTNFPTAVDTITRKRDVDLTTKSLLDQYYGYVNSGNFTAAAQLIDESPELKQTIMSAEDYNRVRDGLIAVERVFNSDIEDFIAKVVKSKGEWSPTVEYDKYNVVTYAIKYVVQAYIALPKDESVMKIPMGTLPTDTDYWTCITLRGEKGTSGTGMAPRGAFDEETQYYKDDLVAYDNTLYAATGDVIGETPGSSDKWQKLTIEPVSFNKIGPITIEADAWDSSRAYNITNSNVTDKSFIEVQFNSASLDAAAISAITVESGDGVITFKYNDIKPTSAITIDNVWIRQETPTN